jgi:endonuclease III
MAEVCIEQIMSRLVEVVQYYPKPLMDAMREKSNDPFKILIGTILSARTRDAVVEQVIQRLFQRISVADDFLPMATTEIEKLIYPVGFYREKAKHFKQLPIVLNKLFSGQIPQTMDELLKLPGVGRKTANLVLILAFDKPAICVDTHVHRICNQIGYISTQTPLETEIKLREMLPQKYWKVYNSTLVAFGQNICKPVKPKCEVCPISELCAFFNM